MAAFLLNVTTVEAGPPQGRTIFTMQCISCHSINRPAARPTIDEALGEKGPAMWYAGSKYKEGFIKRWIQDPKPLRGMVYNSLTERSEGGHMTLDTAEAAEVATYLMGLTSPDVVEVEIKPKATVRGRFIFQKKLGCYGCHTIKRGSRVVGGLTGPTLLGTADRLNPQWIYSYIKNPGAFTPRSPMPNYSKMLSEVKLKALIAYIAAQK
ncbi:MAG: c-type cytochrome [Thermodesulfobacteriota bacterium]